MRSRTFHRMPDVIARRKEQQERVPHDTVQVRADHRKTTSAAKAQLARLRAERLAHETP